MLRPVLIPMLILLWSHCTKIMQMTLRFWMDGNVFIVHIFPICWLRGNKNLSCCWSFSPLILLVSVFRALGLMPVMWHSFDLSYLLNAVQCWHMPSLPDVLCCSAWFNCSVTSLPKWSMVYLWTLFGSLLVHPVWQLLCLITLWA